MSRTKRNFLITGILFALFIIFTVLIKVVDVQAVGPRDSSVGFATINMAIYNFFGEKTTWYAISEWLGNIAIFVAGLFGLIGLVQLIKGRSLKAVNYRIIILGLFYVLVIGFYALFEVVVINQRPVLMEGVLEASYPSSHTMLTLCIMSTAIMNINHFFEDKKLVMVLLDVLCIAILLLTLIGRTICGVHWFTDILGGVLLSSSLIMLYYTLVDFIDQNFRRRKVKTRQFRQY